MFKLTRALLLGLALAFTLSSTQIDAAYPMPPCQPPAYPC